MEIIPFESWERNARIVSGDTEIVVTLEVGPRIIRLGKIGGPNMFAVFPEDAGQSDDVFHGYGGHRLWIGPEELERTYQPDNSPVEFIEEDGFFVFSTPTDKYFTQKQMRIKPIEPNGFIIDHRVYNHGAYGIKFAPWSLSQCAGGEVVVPQTPFKAHVDEWLPARPLALWAYTRLSDARWTIGDRVIRLRHDPNRSGSQKVGTFVEQGIAAQCNLGQVFIKRFGAEGAIESYPDYGSNFETFTRDDMLEVESLGPLQEIAPGSYAAHRETWYLVSGERPPTDDSACAAWLEVLAAKYPL